MAVGALLAHADNTLNDMQAHGPCQMCAPQCCPFSEGAVEVLLVCVQVCMNAFYFSHGSGLCQSTSPTKMNKNFNLQSESDA